MLLGGCSAASPGPDLAARQAGRIDNMAGLPSLASQPIRPPAGVPVGILQARPPSLPACPRTDTCFVAPFGRPARPLRRPAARGARAFARQRYHLQLHLG